MKTEQRLRRLLSTVSPVDPKTKGLIRQAGFHQQPAWKHLGTTLEIGAEGQELCIGTILSGDRISLDVE